MLSYASEVKYVIDIVSHLISLSIILDIMLAIKFKKEVFSADKCK